jgi:hypothetical protein
MLLQTTMGHWVCRLKLAHRAVCMVQLVADA